jgi:S1-C subfamily serine protease
MNRILPRVSSPSYLWLPLLLMAIGGIIGWRLWLPVRSPLNPDAVPRAITPRGDLAEDEKTTIAIFRQASPSVVHITTMSVHQDRFTLDTMQIPRGTGSGFMWDRDGHVVTNYHMIQNAAVARMTLGDHSNWRGKLVGAYPDRDLAVLMIDAPQDKLRAIPVGTASDLQVGQKVFAIGTILSAWRASPPA